MLKFNYKKERLNFMAEWQSAAVPDDEGDWLRVLASSTDGTQRDGIRREILDSCELAVADMEMAEENDG